MKNLKNKKNIAVIISSFFVLIIGIFSLGNPIRLKLDKLNISEKEVSQIYSSTIDVHKDLMKKIKNTNKIEVYHDYHVDNVDDINPITVSDKNIINDYLNLLSKDVKQSNQDLSGSSINNQKLVFYTDREKIEVNYSYDDLYNFGFISYGNKDIYLDYDFFRLISNTARYSPKESNICDDVENLFKKYNWTPSFLITKHKVKLCDDLMYSPEKGIDEVYYLLEPLPNFAYPIVDTRAIVLKHNNKIIGAYIDSGIINRAICSLDRKSFDEITGYILEDYLIENHIDKNSKLNKEIGKLSIQKIIETYYKSQSDKDVNRYLSTLDIGAIVSLLEPDNCDIKGELFNSIDKKHDIFKYANKIELLEVKDNDEVSGMKEVNIKLNILKSNQITIDKGIYDMIVNMRKNENGVYKINSVGF